MTTYDPDAALVEGINSAEFERRGNAYRIREADSVRTGFFRELG